MVLLTHTRPPEERSTDAELTESPPRMRSAMSLTVIDAAPTIRTKVSAIMSARATVALPLDRRGSATAMNTRSSVPTTGTIQPGLNVRCWGSSSGMATRTSTANASDQRCPRRPGRSRWSPGVAADMGHPR